MSKVLFSPASEVGPWSVHTCPSIETQGEIKRRLQTHILVNVTVLPSETICTYTGIFVQKIHTGASIKTWVSLTLLA